MWYSIIYTQAKHKQYIWVIHTYLTAWMHLSSSLLESSQLISHLINLLLCLAKMEFASNCYTLKIYTVVNGSQWSTVFVLQALPISMVDISTRRPPFNWGRNRQQTFIKWNCLQKTRFPLALCFLCSKASLLQYKSIFF